MKNYNPDVLTCLANLSNDEVFTPPVVVNRMLDLLPAELWRNPDARFLDPVSKTGVFLREIAKRLMVGLCERIPDRQSRPHLHPTVVRLGHYRTDGPSVAPFGLLQQTGERALFCLHGLSRCGWKYPLPVYGTHLAERPMPLLRGEPGGIRPRRHA